MAQYPVFAQNNIKKSQIVNQMESQHVNGGHASNQSSKPKAPQVVIRETAFIHNGKASETLKISDFQRLQQIAGAEQILKQADQQAETDMMRSPVNLTTKTQSNDGIIVINASLLSPEQKQLISQIQTEVQSQFVRPDVQEAKTTQLSRSQRSIVAPNFQYGRSKTQTQITKAELQISLEDRKREHLNAKFLHIDELLQMKQKLQDSKVEQLTLRRSQLLEKRAAEEALRQQLMAKQQERKTKMEEWRRGREIQKQLMNGQSGVQFDDLETPKNQKGDLPAPLTVVRSQPPLQAYENHQVPDLLNNEFDDLDFGDVNATGGNVFEPLDNIPDDPTVFANPPTSVHIPQVSDNEVKGSYIEAMKGPKGQRLFGSKMCASAPAEDDECSAGNQTCAKKLGDDGRQTRMDAEISNASNIGFNKEDSQMIQVNYGRNEDDGGVFAFDSRREPNTSGATCHKKLGQQVQTEQELEMSHNQMFILREDSAMIMPNRCKNESLEDDFAVTQNKTSNNQMGQPNVLAKIPNIQSIVHQAPNPKQIPQYPEQFTCKKQLGQDQFTEQQLELSQHGAIFINKGDSVSLPPRPACENSVTDHDFAIVGVPKANQEELINLNYGELDGPVLNPFVQYNVDESEIDAVMPNPATSVHLPQFDIEVDQGQKNTLEFSKIGKKNVFQSHTVSQNLIDTCQPDCTAVKQIGDDKGLTFQQTEFSQVGIFFNKEDSAYIQIDNHNVKESSITDLEFVFGQQQYRDDLQLSPEKLMASSCVQLQGVEAIGESFGILTQSSLAASVMAQSQAAGVIIPVVPNQAYKKKQFLQTEFVFNKNEPNESRTNVTGTDVMRSSNEIVQAQHEQVVEENPIFSPQQLIEPEHKEQPYPQRVPLQQKQQLFNAKYQETQGNMTETFVLTEQVFQQDQFLGRGEVQEEVIQSSFIGVNKNENPSQSKRLNQKQVFQFDNVLKQLSPVLSLNNQAGVSQSNVQQKQNTQKLRLTDIDTITGVEAETEQVVKTGKISLVPKFETNKMQFKRNISPQINKFELSESESDTPKSDQRKVLSLNANLLSMQLQNIQFKKDPNANTSQSHNQQSETQSQLTDFSQSKNKPTIKSPQNRSKFVEFPRKQEKEVSSTYSYEEEPSQESRTKSQKSPFQNQSQSTFYNFSQKPPLINKKQEVQESSSSDDAPKQKRISKPLWQGEESKKKAVKEAVQPQKSLTFSCEFLNQGQNQENEVCSQKEQQDKKLTENKNNNIKNQLSRKVSLIERMRQAQNVGNIMVDLEQQKPLEPTSSHVTIPVTTREVCRDHVVDDFPMIGEVLTSPIVHVTSSEQLLNQGQIMGDVQVREEPVTEELDGSQQLKKQTDTHHPLSRNHSHSNANSPRAAPRKLRDNENENISVKTEVFDPPEVALPVSALQQQCATIDNIFTQSIESCKRAHLLLDVFDPVNRTKVSANVRSTAKSNINHSMSNTRGKAYDEVMEVLKVYL